MKDPFRNAVKLVVFSLKGFWVIVVRTIKNPSFKKLLLTCLIVGAIFLGGIALWAATLTLPDLGSFDSRLVGQSTKIYDRTGEILLYDINQNVRRTVIPFDQISTNMKHATVAIEDDQFYSHHGIRIESIIRAVLANIFSAKYTQGGSTITQQVIKNSLLTSDKTVTRKIKEWILAIKLERAIDKDTILNLYLNQAPYGGNIYGVEEASQAYFGIKSADLSISQAAYLSAIPQQPPYYSPFGRHLDALEQRKNNVLKKMLDSKFISQEEYSTALNEKPEFKTRGVNALKAPHFVMYVRDYLAEKYGDDAVENGGLKVITTLNYDLESKAEDIVGKYVIANKTKFKADNGTLVAVDPANGQILTMVGSRDYFDKEINGNFNVATAHRQPGSAFKPFVYSTLFNKGYTPDTILFDTKTEFSAGCSPEGFPVQKGAQCYSPQNYEGGFKGPMTVRAAIGESRNVPAVKALYLAGITDSLTTATAMGINQLGGENQYGLSLVLGGAEVAPLDIAAAYGVFAMGGKKNPVTAILEVKDKDGNILESFSTSSEQVIPRQSALLMNDILADKYARAPIFGSKYFGDKDVGMKTGTTNDSKDAWIIGYTPHISVASWMGNNKNTPMVQKASAIIVAPMWKQFMDYALTKFPSDRIERADPIDTSNLKPIMTGVWQNPEGLHDILYYVDKSNPLGPAPSNPASDPAYNNWEYGVSNWALANGYTPGSGVVSTSTDPGAVLGGGGTGSNQVIPVQIVTPSSGQIYKSSDKITTTLNMPAQGVVEVVYSLNNNFLGSSNVFPFSITFSPNQNNRLVRENTLAVNVFGQNGTLLGTNFVRFTVSDVQ